MPYKLYDWEFEQSKTYQSIVFHPIKSISMISYVVRAIKRSYVNSQDFFLNRTLM